MNKPGDLIYLPSSAPIISKSTQKKWEVLYPDKPGYYIVCEQQPGPSHDHGWFDAGSVTIIYNGRMAWVSNKHIKKEY